MFKLVCVHPYYDRDLQKHIQRGDEITDPDVVAKRQDDLEHHFVRVAVQDAGLTKKN